MFGNPVLWFDCILFNFSTITFKCRLFKLWTYSHRWICAMNSSCMWSTSDFYPHVPPLVLPARSRKTWSSDIYWILMLFESLIGGEFRIFAGTLSFTWFSQWSVAPSVPSRGLLAMAIGFSFAWLLAWSLKAESEDSKLWSRLFNLA